MAQTHLRSAFRTTLGALALSVAALPVWAQFIDTRGPQDILASDFIGMPVYGVDPAAGAPVVAGRGDWDTIGEIGDLLLDQTGQVRAVLVDVGGFLGIGERTVALDMTRLTVLTDETGTRFVTVAATRPELEGAPPFAVGPGVAPGGTGMDATAPAVPGTATTAEPAYAPVPPEAVTAEALQDVTVYDQTGANIGEIAEVFVQEGKVTEVAIDIGGFLGVGERRVIFPYDQLQILQQPGDDELRVEVDASREMLEQMPVEESRG